MATQTVKTLKICIKCHLEKSNTEFYRHDRPGKMRNDCRNCRVIYSKNWRLKNPEKFKQATKSWYLKNHDKMLERQRNVTRQIREEMFTALGDQCACCYEKDKRFLSLDHINNDGYLERNNIRSRWGIYKAQKDGWPKSVYQILCYNCNLGKAFNGLICPHKKELK